ncbi:hypothetical protein L2E82_48461 [Cichorium intybus]|uniref:Uncharacterized protein n=1 Tax=Cichorium intybus TaxID=13427 RepID=A0ACB8YYZ6_CICIN|nr:hypothetical protein L2E82_48461 [Cichorium intybus]
MHRPFTELVRSCYKRNNISGIIFGNIKDEINPCSLKAFTTIAYRCLKRDREKRPLTNEVVRILETALKYQVPPPPPPPLPPPHSKSYTVSPPPQLPESFNVPPPPPHSYGSIVPPRPILSSGISSTSSNQRPLKPLQPGETSAKEGSLWNLSHKQGNHSRDPEIDITELESLFSTASVSTGTHKDRHQPNSEKLKPTNVRLVKPLRASSWEIMLGKINLPQPDIINAILSLDSSAISVHHVYNLIEFCPTKEEMEMVKYSTGDKKMLGQCEQFFLECAKIPRIKQKLRVFAFTITFSSQVNNLRENLRTIKDATKEILESKKLVKIMQIILTMGNKLNAGTTQGSAGGFRLDNFRNLGYTYATDKKITLLHFLCKVVAEQTPELLDFDKDLFHLQSASMIQIKSLLEDKYAIINGFEKAQQEYDTSANDGGVSIQFREALKSFLVSADAQLPLLTSSFDEAAQYADSLAIYFGEDPSRSPWEQVTSSLARFIVKFKKAHEENKQWADADQKKLVEVVEEDGASS